MKKLVYVYLVRYAEEQQDLALLSISTFQRGLKVHFTFLECYHDNTRVFMVALRFETELQIKKCHYVRSGPPYVLQSNLLKQLLFAILLALSAAVFSSRNVSVPTDTKTD